MTSSTANGRRIILASASPRRHDLLAAAGITFGVAPAEVDEDVHSARPGAGAEEIAVGLAVRKAIAGAARAEGEALVLGADTLVVAPGGTLLGKPEGPDEAWAMIERLNGARHAVVTGVAVACARSGRVRARAVESLVRFRRLAAAEVAEYVASGRWRDKAGAYGAQDRPSLVDEVEGSLTNVIGLPMEVIPEMLEAEAW